VCFTVNAFGDVLGMTGGNPWKDLNLASSRAVPGLEAG
jgi:hypothetical protein